MGSRVSEKELPKVTFRLLARAAGRLEVLSVSCGVGCRAAGLRRVEGRQVPSFDPGSRNMLVIEGEVPGQLDVGFIPLLLLYILSKANLGIG